MRHAVFASLLLLSTGALSASAQSSTFAEAPVRVQVAPRPISMTANGATDFGLVAGADIINGGVTAIIDPRARGAGQSTATFLVNGEPNTRVTVSCRAFADLLTADRSHSLRFDPDVVHSTDGTNQAGAGSGCAAGIGFSFNQVLNAHGELHMWLGGRLSSIFENPPTAGAYSGAYTLTIAY